MKINSLNKFKKGGDMEKKLGKDEFEKNLEQIDDIIEKLEMEDLTLNEGIKEYEKAMKLLKKTSEILNLAQGKIIKIEESTKGELILKEVEEDV